MRFFYLACLHAYAWSLVGILVALIPARRLRVPAFLFSALSVAGIVATAFNATSSFRHVPGRSELSWSALEWADT